MSQWSAETTFVASSHGLLAVLPPKAPYATIAGFNISPSNLLSSSPASFTDVLLHEHVYDSFNVQLANTINHFVRTPNGRGLVATTVSGEVGVWYNEAVGKVPSGGPVPRSLTGKAYWQESHFPSAGAIFSKGRAIVFFKKEALGGTITLQHINTGKDTPEPPVYLPEFELDLQDDIAFLLASSDIDDGYETAGRRTQRALIIAASKQGHAWIWRVDSKTDKDGALTGDVPDISLISSSILPVEGDEPHLILPVDPMGWHEPVFDWKNNVPLQDLILTVSKTGILEFWSPEVGHHFPGERPHSERVGRKEHLLHDDDHLDVAWRRSGMVRTERSNVLMARCSSRKKTVLGELDAFDSS